MCAFFLGHVCHVVCASDYSESVLPPLQWLLPGTPFPGTQLVLSARCTLSASAILRFNSRNSTEKCGASKASLRADLLRAGHNLSVCRRRDSRCVGRRREVLPRGGLGGGCRECNLNICISPFFFYSAGVSCVAGNRGKFTWHVGSALLLLSVADLLSERGAGVGGSQVTCRTQVVGRRRCISRLSCIFPYSVFRWTGRALLKALRTRARCLPLAAKLHYSVISPRHLARPPVPLPPPFYLARNEIEVGRRGRTGQGRAGRSEARQQKQQEPVCTSRDIYS